MYAETTVKTGVNFHVCIAYLVNKANSDCDDCMAAAKTITFYCAISFSDLAKTSSYYLTRHGCDFAAIQSSSS